MGWYFDCFFPVLMFWLDRLFFCLVPSCFFPRNVEDFNLTLYISFPLRATFFDLLGLEDSTSISVLRTHFFGKIVSLKNNQFTFHKTNSSPLKSSHPKRIVFRPSFLRGELLNFRGESSMKFAGCLFPDFFACKYRWRSGTKFAWFVALSKNGATLCSPC